MSTEELIEQIAAECDEAVRRSFIDGPEVGFRLLETTRLRQQELRLETDQSVQIVRIVNCTKITIACAYAEQPHWFTATLNECVDSGVFEIEFLRERSDDFLKICQIKSPELLKDVLEEISKIMPD